MQVLFKKEIFTHKGGYLIACEIATLRSQ